MAVGAGQTVTMEGTVFDDILYDVEADVLYMSVGPPRAGADYDASIEGHGLRYDEGDKIVGLTIVGARWYLERDGELVVTETGYDGSVTRVSRIPRSELEPALTAKKAA